MFEISNKTDINKLFHYIIENKDLRTLSKCSCKNQNNLLHIFINKGDFEAFRELLCLIKESNDTKLKNKLINQKNSNGDTPMHIAVRKSNKEYNIYSIMAEALENIGAKLNIHNNKNEVISCLGKKNQYKNDTKLEKKEQYINDCTNFNERNESEIESDIRDNFSEIETPDNPLQHSVLKIFLFDNFDKNNHNNRNHSQNNYQIQNIEKQSQQEILQRQLQRQLQEQTSSVSEQEHHQHQQHQQHHQHQQHQQYQQHQRQLHSMYGGNRDSDSDSESESESSPDSQFNGIRKINNPYLSGGSKISEKNHNDAIENIKNLGYDELDAKDIKNFLYYEIKENYPDLNNDERSEKLLDNIKTLKKMDIKKVRKELEKYRERKENNMVSKKEHQKEPKKEKKEKKSKRTSKRKSSKRKSSKRSYK